MAKNKNKNKNSNKNKDNNKKKSKSKSKKMDRGSPDLLRFEITTDPSMSIYEYDTLLSKSVILGSQIDRRLQEAERLLLECYYYVTDGDLGTDEDLGAEIEAFLNGDE